MRNGSRWLLPPLLLLGFLYAVVAIVMVPLESGELYPPYSTLRADPLGSKILFDSLAEMQGLRVERNFQMLASIKSMNPGTLFFMGGSGPNFVGESEGQLKEWESLAANGWRLVFVFQNAMPKMDANLEVFKKENPKVKSLPALAIFLRWGMLLKLRSATVTERAAIDRTPRNSALYFEGDPTWQVISREKDGHASHVEKAMGKGSVALLSQIFPLSNEGLRERPNGELVSTLVGSNKRVVFDEFHNNIQETGSIGTLLRRYRLEATVALLMLAGVLFLWRNSTSLLPMRASSAASAVLGRDTRQGMISLLQRSVPRDQLIGVCLAEWEKARTLLTVRSGARGVLPGPAAESPAVAYRRIHRQLTEHK